MTEVEQLRKEINELRERIVVLERKPPTVVGPVYTGFPPRTPQFVPWPTFKPYEVTCSTPPEYTLTSQNKG